MVSKYFFLEGYIFESQQLRTSHQFCIEIAFAEREWTIRAKCNAKDNVNGSFGTCSSRPLVRLAVVSFFELPAKIIIKAFSPFNDLNGRKIGLPFGPLVT